MAGLVHRDRPRVLLGILDVDRRARLDGRHRLEDVVVVEPLPSVGVGVRESHRAHLLDHRRRVSAGDPRQLVPLLLGVEFRLMRDLADIEVEDVLAVALRRRPEPDVAAHPPRPRKRRIELRERDVRRADEVDLVLARLRPRDAKLEPADARRDEVGRVEEGVRPVREEAPEEGRVVDPVHDDEQLVQRELAAAHHSRNGALPEDPREPPGSAALLSRSAKRRSRHARVSRIMSPSD